jgi:hypothetical protein
MNLTMPLLTIATVLLAWPSFWAAHSQAVGRVGKAPRGDGLADVRANRIFLSEWFG